MKTTLLILSFVFTLLTLTTSAKPYGYYHHRYHRPVVVYVQPTPPVYYQPVPPPICQYAPPPPVVVYRPAPCYRNEYHHEGHYRGGNQCHQGRGNNGYHR